MDEKRRLSSFARFTGIVSAASAVVMMATFRMSSVNTITSNFKMTDNPGADLSPRSLSQFGQQLAHYRDLRSKGRIVGGTTSTQGQFPWIISLRYGDAGWSGPSCGGSLITPSIVLTAAHCIGAIAIADFNRYDQEEDEGVQRRFFEEGDIIGHETYSHTTLDNDFALIKLKEPIENPSLIKLNADPDLPSEDGLRVTVIGWGHTEYNGESSQLQQYAQLDYVGQEDCLKKFGGHYITDNMLCAYTEGVDACQGDSGGPLVNLNTQGEEVLVGVVSWGSGCASTYPGVYARVSQAIEWIESKLCGSDGISSEDCDGNQLKSEYKAGEGGSIDSVTVDQTGTDATQETRTECEDLESFDAKSKSKKRTCEWVKNKLKDERCERYWMECPLTCDKCEEFLSSI
mmetsp:Transcript_4954/g.7204  ORF Transcript_4954/g.7204 Transcript_4954/m.7204 type:complete len:401 (-) Transcript_4954:93-1295(-)|eukprot:CAMPEP_0202459270 /NCGR_PEP_ID=MMETSP1360-20130828/34195_1 /ASSEMBLY_ACC=CAM_ASM_000848 /TAXON_ID=515479 /ORGANISM="Licmophora paradoxa, Strain CCMP2313" /LENGTH=400 /DNA_ID=CAMNT_0049080265 /DNA_START=19 /DNA_END=1221 /DNA_ORIENTATION=+